MQTLLPEHQVKDLHSEHAAVDIVLFQPDDIIVVKGQIVFIREDSIQIGLARLKVCAVAKRERLTFLAERDMRFWQAS